MAVFSIKLYKILNYAYLSLNWNAFRSIYFIIIIIIIMHISKHPFVKIDEYQNILWLNMWVEMKRGEKE